MIRKRRIFLVILAIIIPAGLIIPVLAVAGDPLALFTENIAATGPTQDLTVMEQVLLEKINRATSSIDMAIYDFNRVSIQNALIEAKERGLTVRVVADNEAYANPDYQPHFAALEAAAIPVVRDNRSSIMHNKFFVIDGKIVWTGSTNVSDNCFSLNHNNSVVFTSTELAEIYSTEFNEMFVDGKFGTRKTDNVTHTLDYNGNPLEVYFSPKDGALEQVIAEVYSATQSIYFSIFYFTDDALRQALVERAQAGVTIAGVWDQTGAGNRYSEDEALCKAGIPIKIENFVGKMHNKFMVLDAGSANPRVVTGSMNWSASGNGDNDENTVIIHDAEVVQAYQAAFQKLYNALGPETLCQFQFVYVPIISRNP